MSANAMDQRDGWIWYNGEFVPWKDAKLHVLTHGLHYASSVFEGERSYGGQIFKLREHTDRLIASAKYLDFEIPYSADEIDEACRQAIVKNGLENSDDTYLRPFAWRGAEELGVPARNNKVHLAIAVWDWPSYYTREDRLKGARLTIAKWRRPDPATIPCKAKAAGLYMICMLSKHAAMDDGYSEALMLDYRGLVAEATSANVFFYRDGELHTPTPDCFLDGITRQTIIDLAERNGLKIVERPIKPEELGDFEECFLTGTAAEVTPVAQIGEHKYHPGKICQLLVDAYASEVRHKSAAAE
ncbi:MAG: branched-chain amino acid aminotransferase [Devosiaceae bacterium]|nr:branched-chain amino acid aminotransferase [Devosiaceae bacterium]